MLVQALPAPVESPHLLFILLNATVGCSRSPNELVHRELLLPILPTFVLDRALLDRIDDIVTRGTMINPAEQLPESSAGTDSEAPLEVNPICGALGPDASRRRPFGGRLRPAGFDVSAGSRLRPRPRPET